MAIFSAKSIMELRAVFFCKCCVLYNTDKCGMEGGGSGLSSHWMDFYHR